MKYYIAKVIKNAELNEGKYLDKVIVTEKIDTGYNLGIFIAPYQEDENELNIVCAVSNKDKAHISEYGYGAGDVRCYIESRMNEYLPYMKIDRIYVKQVSLKTFYNFLYDANKYLYRCDEDLSDKILKCETAGKIVDLFETKTVETFDLLKGMCKQEYLMDISKEEQGIKKFKEWDDYSFEYENLSLKKNRMENKKLSREEIDELVIKEANELKEAKEQRKKEGKETTEDIFEELFLDTDNVTSPVDSVEIAIDEVNEDDFSITHFNNDYEKEIGYIAKTSNKTNRFGLTKNYVFIVDNLDKYEDDITNSFAAVLKDNNVIKEDDNINFVDYNVVFKDAKEDMTLSDKEVLEKGKVTFIKMPFQYDIVSRHADTYTKNPVIHKNVDATLYKVQTVIKKLNDKIVTSIKKRSGEEVVVFLCDGELDYRKNRIFDKELGDMAFKVINFNEIKTEKVNDYFKKKLSDDGILDVDVKTISKLAFDNSIFKSLKNQHTRRLDFVYNNWKNEYLYKCDLKSESEYKSDKEKYRSGKELIDELLGVKEAKSVVEGICKNHLFQKLRQEQDLKDAKCVKHMAFVGNPGTGKTTLARKLAKVFYQNGIIDNDEIMEFGTENLVSQWVGGTEENCRAKIEDAIGGVLFVDEAYSLLHNEKLGNIIIDMLVREMENNRNNMVVILAGYKDEMEELLRVNPGLSSRISVVNFDDFTSEELVSIADKYAKSKDYELNDSAKRYIKDYCDIKMSEKNFGNGRFVRNLVEGAIKNHSTMLIDELAKATGKSNKQKITNSVIDKKKLKTLSAKDFPIVTKKEEKQVVGFH